MFGVETLKLKFRESTPVRLELEAREREAQEDLEEAKEARGTLSPGRRRAAKAGSVKTWLE